jgi:hypothetical protein
MNKEAAELRIDKDVVDSYGNNESFTKHINSMLAKNISEQIYHVIKTNGEVIIDLKNDRVAEYILNTAQVVYRNTIRWQPLIRCKNCMWYGIHELKKDGTDDRRYKPSFCTLYDRLRDPDWFCGDGAPKDEDNGSV